MQLEDQVFEDSSSEDKKLISKKIVTESNQLTDYLAVQTQSPTLFKILQIILGYLASLALVALNLVLIMTLSQKYKNSWPNGGFYLISLIYDMTIG